MTQQRIGVVGAGLMGREIALVFALAGHVAVLLDQSQDALDDAMRRLAEIVAKAIQRGLLAEDSRAALTRIHATVERARFAECDFVTEAVFETVEVKAAVLRWLADVCKPACVIATNTSTIPITVLASHLPPERRARFVGTHYFSPVLRMPLVEVIGGLETASETVATAMALCRGIGKTPIEVKDVPGFAVNRVLHAFMIEAVRLVEEGVATPADIDLACRLGLGHPMGPFELMDATTSRLCLQSQEIMFNAYGERFRPRPLLKQRVAAGYVGGRGRPGWRSDDNERKRP